MSGAYGSQFVEVIGTVQPDLSIEQASPIEFGDDFSELFFCDLSCTIALLCPARFLFCVVAFAPASGPYRVPRDLQTWRTTHSS